MPVAPALINALETAASILYMVPTKKVDRTPYEIWHMKAPKLSYLRVWGCEALVKQDTPNKLDSISIKCIFVGYSKETMGYYFYYPLKNKIFVSRNAEFFENSFMVQEASGSHGLLEMSGSDKGLELIQEEDTQPSKNTSEAHNEVAPIEVDPQNVGVPIHRSERIPQVPNKYSYYVDIEEYELGDFNEPPNYKVALADHESNKWLEAMNTKMQSMKDNQVWYLVDLPSNGRTVRCKWLFKNKTDMDGNVYTFKAWRKIPESPWGSSIPIGDRDGDVNRFPDGDGDGDRDEAKKLGWGWFDHTAVKTILKYLRNTKDMVLVYGAKPEDELKVSCYADASFQTDKDDTKSKTRYVFVLNGGAVDWKSAKQSTIAMSSTEDKYITFAEASVEAVWIRKFIDGLGDVMPSNKRPMEMLCDNEHALAIASDPEILKGARHFQRKYHYIREVIQEGEIVLNKVNTDDNVADPFTKPMSFNKHFEHAMVIGIVPSSSLM
ncbi:hypothetical protein Tco_0139603 [Tanacetum coccineum]